MGRGLVKIYLLHSTTITYQKTSGIGSISLISVRPTANYQVITMGEPTAGGTTGKTEETMWQWQECKQQTSAPPLHPYNVWPGEVPPEMLILL